MVEGYHCLTEAQRRWLLRVDTVEKLPKCIAAKNRPNDILSENPCSMPPQCGYGGRPPLQRQLRPSPKSVLDSQAYGYANFGS